MQMFSTRGTTRRAVFSTLPRRAVFPRLVRGFSTCDPAPAPRCAAARDADAAAARRLRAANVQAGRPFFVLSLDGGGVRGLFTIRVLERLCERLPWLLDRVNLVAGTSTGGLLGLPRLGRYIISARRI